MKKTALLIIALMLTMGFAQAQDVYFAGNGNNTGKIWKNDTLIHSISDTSNVVLRALQITQDGTILSAGYTHGETYVDSRGRIWMNDSLVFTAQMGSTINDLKINGDDWTAGGTGVNEWEMLKGIVWRNGEVLHTYSDSINQNFIQTLAIDTLTDDVYAGGSTGAPEILAATWKNDALFWQMDSISSVCDLFHDGTDLYAAGYVYLDYSDIATLWQNDSIIFSIDDSNSVFEAIALYNGSIYLAGQIDTTLCVWQDGEVIYSHPITTYSEITALCVNEFGIYYAGQCDSVATVWKDGEILYQPESCEEIVALVVMAEEVPVTYYTITVESDNPDWGTVSGGGEYPLGGTIQIEAIPNVGHEFLMWNDSITDNPREIVVTQDSTFVAMFAVSQYTITVVSDHPDWGIVTGGGTFYYGDTIEIAATPYIGFEFVKWNDGNTDNPRTIIVTENQEFKAYFGIQQCLIKAEVTPVGAGTVNGGGTYDYGTTIHLTAHSSPGYMFSEWDDGVITNPRSVFVESDSTFTAVFTLRQYEITTACSPEEGGTVSGGGIYDYGSTAVLKATPNENFIFLCWNDGIVTNPRNVTVTQDATYTALFHQSGTPTYTITVRPNNPLLGSVSGEGEYPEGAIIEIGATPSSNAYFVGWDDGNTDNPRSIVVTQDETFIANFEFIPTYTITVVSENPLMGTVYGGGSYTVNSTATIGATPNNGFYFSGWQDGNMDNPRNITVTGNASYTASFTQVPVQSYTITVYYDETQGYVLGAGTYLEGSTATLVAIPNDEYRFKRWSDGNTDSRREIIVDHDIILAAFFDGTGLDENEGTNLAIYPNPAKDHIRIEGLEAKSEIGIYNMMGIQVKSLTLNGEDEIQVGDLAAGIYLIRINGSHSVKFVKR